MKRAKNTKQKIFDSATKLFSQFGYENVSMVNICKMVGVTEAALYRHYDCKAAIREAIFSECEQKIAAYLSLLDKENIDIYLNVDTARNVLNRCVIQFESEDIQFMSDAFRIMFQDFLTNERAHDLVMYQIHDELAKRIKYVVDQLVEREKIPPLDSEAYSLIWARYTLSTVGIWVSHIYHDGPKQKSGVLHEKAQKLLIDFALGERSEDGSN